MSTFFEIVGFIVIFTLVVALGAMIAGAKIAFVVWVLHLLS